MEINLLTIEAGAVKAAHRTQCFDAVRVALGLGDTKGDTGLWLDRIEAVMDGRSSKDVVELFVTGRA